MMSKQTKFILAITLQIIIVFVIVVSKMSVLTGGVDVLLKIAPVDPRDTLRGDYTTFQYGISNLDSRISAGQQIRNGDTIYVILKQNGEYYFAQNIQKTKPVDEVIFIKGKVESGGVDVQSDTFQNQNFNNSRIHVVYGIEDYFIPEGKGQGFSFWNKEVVARVTVDKNGNAVLKQLYVDDKPWP